MYMYIYIYIYIYIGVYRRFAASRSRDPGISSKQWILCRGGRSGWGVQWIGVVLCNKLVYNSVHITTPCFHYTPLCRM